MNSTTVLLGIIGAMLLVAFVLSFGAMQRARQTPDSAAELERIQQEIDLLRSEAASIRERGQQREVALVPDPIPEPSPVDAETQARIAQLEAEIAATEMDNIIESPEPTQAEEAPPEEVQLDRREARNQRAVENAMLFGKVTSYNPDYGFLTFEIENGRAFVEGEKIAIRRNGGILANGVISALDGNSASASVLPNQLAPGGVVAVRPGDEIILLPDFFEEPTSPTESLDSNSGGIPPLRDLPPLPTLENP